MDCFIKGLKEYFYKSSFFFGVFYFFVIFNKRKDIFIKKLVKWLGRDDMLDVEIDVYIYCVSVFVKLV